MSKIVKNNTASALPINDTGVTIIASGQYTIPPNDYLLWAASSDIIIEIGNSNITINDGSSDLNISDGTDLIKGIFPSEVSISGMAFTGDKLKVEAQVTTSPSSSNGCPVISNKLRFDYNNVKHDVVSSYTTYYTYTGSGKLFYFVLDANSDDIRVKLTIDSTEILFELTLDDIEDMQSFSGNGCNDKGHHIGFITKTSGNKVNFKPDCAILYNSEIKIEVQRTKTKDKKIDKSIIVLTKES